MKLEWKDIINRNKNETCFVCGHGTSLTKVTPRLSEYKNKGIKIIACNDWYNFYDIKPDYWILASSHFRMNNLYEKINNYNIPVFYSRSADISSESWVEKRINSDYIGYTHNNQYKKPEEKEIGEVLHDFTKYDKCYGGGCTVAVQMFAFSVILGFSNIYLLGIDLDYKYGYANPKMNREIHDRDNFNQYMSNIEEHFDIIYNSAKNIGTKVYNCTYKNFKDIEKVENINL